MEQRREPLAKQVEQIQEQLTRMEALLEGRLVSEDVAVLAFGESRMKPLPDEPSGP